MGLPRPVSLPLPRRSFAVCQGGSSTIIRPSTSRGTVFDFGAPGFWQLVHAARLAVFRAASERDVSLVVTTYCYAEPDDRLAFEEIAELVESRGGALLPVFLQCSTDEIARRLSNADRSGRGKVTSREGLDEFLERFHMCPVPRPNCLTIDTSSESAESTARRIVSHFNLDAAS